MKNKDQMGTFLAKAKLVMDKTDQISPIPQKRIPTMAESASEIGLGSGESYQTFYQNNTGQYSDASSKLPKSILESMTTNPISQYGSTTGLSVLDSIMPPQRQQINENIDLDEKPMPTTEEFLAKSRSMHEHFLPQPNQYQQQTIPNTLPVSGIDYSLIKLMIESCIKEEFKSLKQSMLTESKNNGNGDVILSLGDTIRFVAKNGNVYEGKVKKLGNINEK